MPGYGISRKRGRITRALDLMITKATKKTWFNFFFVQRENLIPDDASDLVKTVSSLLILSRKLMTRVIVRDASGFTSLGLVYLFATGRPFRRAGCADNKRHGFLSGAHHSFPGFPDSHPATGRFKR